MGRIIFSHKGMGDRPTILLEDERLYSHFLLQLPWGVKYKSLFV
jgi:hypothetical protein